MRIIISLQHDASKEAILEKRYNQIPIAKIFDEAGYSIIEIHLNSLPPGLPVKMTPIKLVIGVSGERKYITVKRFSTLTEISGTEEIEYCI